MDPLQTNFRSNSANLANNRSTKLGTLICFAHARTVQPTGADRLDRGPSGLRAGRRLIWCPTPCHVSSTSLSFMYYSAQTTTRDSLNL
jgi:hypothetical protein